MSEKGLAPHRFRQGRGLHGRGKLAEAVAEYQEALRLDPDHFDSLHYLGLALHQQGDTARGLSHIRRALELNGNDLGALTNCGELCRAAGLAFEAEVHLHIAVALHPAVVEARVNLAALYLGQRRSVEAREQLRLAREHAPEGTALMRRLWVIAHTTDQAAPPPSAEQARVQWSIGRELLRRNRPTLALPFLREATTLEPGAAPHWLSLGIAHYDRDDKPQALTAFARSVALDPSSAIALTNLGNAAMETGDEPAAERAYAAAATLAPDAPLARFNQALLKLKQGEWPEAWALYDQRHRLPNARQWPGDRWDGQPISGKRLLVHCEQGVGDTLQFLRFLAPLRDTSARITLAAQRSLSRLCHQVEGIDGFLLEGRAPEFDVRIELLSLPHLLQTTPATLPPPARGMLLPINHPLAEQAAGLRGRKVGLCWGGSPAHPNDWQRSIPLGLLAPLLDARDVAFVSLQIGSRRADIGSEGLGDRLHDWIERVVDFADTAALIAALDLVITADTAVAHLAATLGKPTWILLPQPGEWRWGQEPESTIWYPSARLFRQARSYDWSDVVARLRDDLDHFEVAT